MNIYVYRYISLRDVGSGDSGGGFEVLRCDRSKNPHPNVAKGATLGWGTLGQIGALISMEGPTKPTLKEAAVAGFYHSPGISGAKVDTYPRLQILSIEEMLKGKRLEYPRLLDLTYKKAPKTRLPLAEQQMRLAGAEIGSEDEEGPF